MKAMDLKKSIILTSSLWGILILWYGVALFLDPQHRLLKMVDSIYYTVGHHWLTGSALYDDGSGSGFVYFPQSALLFSPLSLLPQLVFALVFRLLSVALFAWGIYQIAKHLSPNKTSIVYFIITAASVLTAQSTIFEGQMHMIIGGLMLGAFGLLIEEKYWLSAFLLTLSVAVKPTSIVVLLLAFALYPRITFKIILFGLGFLLLPYFTQSASYVNSQYIACLHSFQVVFHHDGLHSVHWATLFGALSFYTHTTFSGPLEFLIRALMAISTLAMGFVAKRKLNKQQAAFFILALGMCYLMLFNSRTENNDYVLMGPIIGFTLANAFFEKKYLLFLAHIILMIGLIINWNLCRWLTPHNNLWLDPTLIGFYTIGLLIGFLAKRSVIQTIPQML